jgi:hypothetical protein
MTSFQTDGMLRAHNFSVFCKNVVDCLKVIFIDLPMFTLQGQSHGKKYHGISVAPSPERAIYASHGCKPVALKV